MLNGLTSEMTKLRTGTTFAAFLVAGVFFIVLSAWGILSGRQAEIAPSSAPEWATTEVVRNWFAMSLVIGMYGAYFVARDFRQGTAQRSILLGGGRAAFFINKLAAGAVIGLIGAATAAILSLPSAWLLLKTVDAEVNFSREAWLVFVGCFIVNTVSGLWGVCIGLIVRNVIAGLLIVVGLCLLVEPALHAIAPDVGRFFMTNAMGSLYLDPRPGLLEAPGAGIVIAAWITALGAAGYFITARKDLA